MTVSAMMFSPLSNARGEQQLTCSTNTPATAPIDGAPYPVTAPSCGRVKHRLAGRGIPGPPDQRPAVCSGSGFWFRVIQAVPVPDVFRVRVERERSRNGRVGVHAYEHEPASGNLGTFGFPYECAALVVHR